MSRKPLEDLGKKQYRARLARSFNISNSDQNVNLESLSTQDGMEHSGGVNTENIEEINDIFNMLVGNPGDHHENNVLIGEILENNQIDIPLLSYHNYDQRNRETDELELDMDTDDQPNAEDTSDDEEDADDIINYADDPIYDGAEITVRESMLAILSMFLKYNLPKACVEDLIRFGELHCLSSGLIKNSLYKFKKFFSFKKNKFKKYFYCLVCNKNVENENEVCSVCSFRRISHFIEMPIEDHLREMFQRKDFYTSLHKQKRNESNNTIIKDVYDEKLYKESVDSGFLSNPNTISFSWYTDGIPVFKSSQMSTWPVYLTINELPFAERKLIQNTLLLGLWYGQKKPSFNNFMSSFQSTLETIKKGIKVQLPSKEKITVKGIVLTGVADLPAKCDCLNFSYFSGYYGCPVCFYRGERMPISERSSVQIFPHTETIELRTLDTCIQYATEARDGNPSHGVKGHTAFSELMPDFVRGMAIDRMHAVDGGVIKKLLTLWFDSSCQDQRFSLYSQVDEINKRLKLIKPPKFIHRIPRGVNELTHWKTSELKNFMFYYSLAVLENIMTVEYFNHYLLLLMGVYLLSQDEIDNNAIDIAGDFLNRFVREFDQLYNPRFASINIHTLLHLANSVKELGPLWAHTCYEYENINGELLDFIHGTKYIDSQVANGHNYLMKMILMMESVQNHNVLRFCTNKKKQSQINTEIGNSTYTVGIYKHLKEIPENILNAFRNIGRTTNIHMWQFNRLLKNNKLYVAKQYQHTMQTDTCAVHYYDGQNKKIGLIDFFVKILQCICMQDDCYCEFEYFAVIQTVTSDKVYTADGDKYRYDSSGFYHKCYPTGNIIVIDIKNLITPCVFITIDECHQYCISPVNTKEIE